MRDSFRQFRSARRLPSGRVAQAARPPAALTLVGGPEEWRLVAPDGRSVFGAAGAQARRRCLEFARSTGALTIFT